jgi:primosomal protein N' (replication factor Y)
MRYVDVVVNVPIRRTFSRQYLDPSDVATSEEFPTSDEAASDASPSFQLFTYELPPELEDVVRPGHLVWAPFGHQEVQGFVLAHVDAAARATRPISRLARPEPVLTDAQLELAKWIADYYLAPLVETIKLFLPPGLLEKRDASAGVHAKRELQVELLCPPHALDRGLEQLGRDTSKSRIMAELIAHTETHTETHGEAALRLEQIEAATGTKGRAALAALVEQGVVVVEADGRLRLPGALADAVAAQQTLRGVRKYASVLAALAAAGAPMWKSELNQHAPADLKLLRDLQAAGIVRLTERVRFRDPLAGRTYPTEAAPALTEEQRAVWAQIAADEFEGDPQPGSRRYLIFGVTGSGKTEVYLTAIAEVLARGKQAIVLVPEIALTPQTVARFAGRFPGQVTVIHSGLSKGERYDVWRQAGAGTYGVIIGPRSALFAPLPRLGLIVIDEEHEPSYKQDAEAWGGQQVFYDARTVAAKLAELAQCPLILGSATPSLEAYHAAHNGEIRLLRMAQRVVGHRTEPASHASVTDYAELPPVELVDMRQELRAGNRSVLSRTLQAELHATLAAGEQAILFLNRRGSSTFVMCRDCGDVVKCARCDSPLTYHERASMLICHRCNLRAPIPTVCAVCGSKRIKYFGTGTERIEELVLEIAPYARMLRWDADTTSGKGSHERILDRFARHEADVLVGTQMIAKGLDLPRVTLVGVISADIGLYLPDFRSGERTFQLLTQVAGRAGRSARGGRVIVQTYSPEHYVIQAAVRHDYPAFYHRELDYRKQIGYPPIRRMARLIYWDKQRDKAEEMALRMADVIERRLQALGLDPAAAAMIGPAPAFFARARGSYRWQIVLVCQDPVAVLRPLVFPFGWRVDIDPVTVL